MKDTFLTYDFNPDSTLNYFIQVPEKHTSHLKNFYTLLIDLAQTEDEIWQNIYHRTRAEIKSFINNTTFEHTVYYNLSNTELQKFTELYNTFAKKKNIRPAETQRLRAYHSAGILAVSFIKQDNAYLSVNFYRITTQRAANIYSFRPEQHGHKYSASHLGKAHRTLHWLDLKEFKKLDIQFYDFCGWYEGNENKELLNINAFKEQFTSNKVLEYTGVIYKNPVLRFLKNITK
ncbi:MAG: hypothetical protein H0W61_04875 [Bacteroidetes bacterium]|nr:hypothetical protein [Bacteroidota bacterium]